MKNKKFNIDVFIQILQKEYEKWDAPVITFMANKGADPFKILVSTVLSLRTKDEVTSKAAVRLFKVAQTPREILELDENRLKKLIYPVGFYHTKAQKLKQISAILIKDYDSTVPDDIDQLLKLPGVGRKTASLVLIEGYNKNAICVDTHVHRISNRTGLVKTKTPDKTERSLKKKLPEKYWKIYNEILVAFGQVVCRPVSPLCSKCRVSFMCPKISVKISR